MKSKVSFSDRVRMFKCAVTGHWEGYELDRRRGRPAARLVNQDSDLDLGTREKLTSEARSLSQVYGICNRILRLYANYCVGTCKAQFQTEDDEWNDMAESAWMTWCKTPDIHGVHNFQKLVRLAVISELRDGDIFFLKTLLGDFPRLQAIESDRVANTKGGTFNIDEEGITGGILHTKAGTPYAYRVCERSRWGQFINPRDVPRASILHYFDPMRFDAYRGISIFSSGGLNHGRDMKEIVAAEKVAVKTNSKIALFWKKIMGGASTMGGVNLFGDSDGESDGQINTQEINDGLIAYGFPSEDLKAHQSDRPSTAWSGFLEFLIHDFAIGTDLPKSFVWSMAGLSGPASRMESQQAKRTFDAKQDAIEGKLLYPALGFVINAEIESGRLPFHPDWWNVRFQRPAHVTIDVGRESTANLAEHARGIISGKELAEERAQDIYEVLTQRAREAQFAKELAEKYDVPIEYVIMMTPNGNTSKPDAEDADSNEQKKGEEKEGEGVSEENKNQRSKQGSFSKLRASQSATQSTPAEAEKAVLQRAQLEAYGVAVRAGVITPTVDDEEHWRKQIGLPPLPQAVRNAWKKEQDVRRPITLAQPGQQNTSQPPTQNPEDE